MSCVEVAFILTFVWVYDYDHDNDDDNNDNDDDDSDNDDDDDNVRDFKPTRPVIKKIDDSLSFVDGEKPRPKVITNTILTTWW